MVSYRFLWATAFISFLFTPTLAQSLTIQTANTWAGIFAGEVVPHEIILTGKQNAYVSLSWKLISKGRTLSSGQQSIRFNDKKTVNTALPLRTPIIKPGLNLEALLVIEANEEVPTSKKVRYESKLIIYGPDLLLENRHFYRQLNIQLFDPIGKTSKLFDKLKIPYQARSKSQLINLTEKGLVVVGAGIDLDQQRGLIKALIEHASNGQRVLILQPITGDFPISDLSTNTGIQVSTMSFMNDSVVGSFAKDYDWITDTSIKNQGLSILNHRQTVLARIAKYNKNNWDWLHIKFDQSRGQLMICMLPFDRYIDFGPVPQIIFSRLLAYASAQLTDLTTSAQGK